MFRYRQAPCRKFSATDSRAAPWSISAGYYALNWNDIQFDDNGDLVDTSTHQSGEVALRYRLPFEGGVLRAVARGAEYQYSPTPGNLAHVILGTSEFDT